MSTIYELRLKQQSVIEFLALEGCTSIEIYRRIKAIYGDDCLDVKNVCQWAQCAISCSGVIKVLSANNWESADFAGNEDRKKKFLRLMGAGKRDSQGNMIGDKSGAPGHGDIEKDLEQQFEKSQEHKRLSGKHGHTGLGFKPEEEETQQEAAVTGGVKKATDNNNTGSPTENLDDEDEEDEEEEEEEEEDEDKSLDDEDDEEDDLSDDDEDDDDVNEDISDEEDDDGEVPTDAKKMKLIDEESH